MLLTLVLVNTGLFIGLGVYAAREARRLRGGSVGMLWSIALLPIVAVVLGGAQRIALQAIAFDRLATTYWRFLVETWQATQTLIVGAIGLATFVRMRRLSARMYDVELIAGNLVDRVKAMSFREFHLTNRESEVLHLIGTSEQVDDRTLARKLSISPATVHTHVMRLLKKTKLRDRRDLAVLAVLLRMDSAVRDPDR